MPKEKPIPPDHQPLTVQANAELGLPGISAQNPQSLQGQPQAAAEPLIKADVQKYTRRIQAFSTKPESDSE